MQPHQRILVALDVDSEDKAIALSQQLSGAVGGLKIGLELVHRAGLGVLGRLSEATGIPIFYDAKLHDIPNTVAGAMSAIGGRGVWMVNMHASGGLRMMKAGADAARNAAQTVGLPAPLIIAVTVLTSLSQEELTDELGLNSTPVEQVTRLASLAQQAGCDGVVASPQEIGAIRNACGAEFLIITPGVRPAGSEAGDQRRVMTPGEAVAAGADYLVIGRPITGATDPREAALRIAKEIADP